MSRKFVPSVVFLFGFLSLPLFAQDPLPLDIPFGVPGVSYSENVPAPQDILGHVIGERHTRPHEIVEYFQAVAESSDRVSFGKYGYSYEHRPLVYAVVTSPQNHARLDEIKATNKLLSDDPESVSDDDLKDMPVIAELHYNVHGNEASGSEAAMLVLYHLAAGRGEAVESVLENAVVVIDPIINPDGRDRYVDWANGNRGFVPTSDPQDREHIEPWPGARTNHYWFDLNRDWLPSQHPESQARLKLFHDWRPQVLIDVHEMGGNSTFFFQPGILSRVNPNTPRATTDLTNDLGEYHARWFDRIGSLYYSRASFDDFYYGKGSTYPDVNGAVALLFEQGSSRALLRETADGILSFPFTIKNQVSASLSTLDGAVSMRQRFLVNQREFYRTAQDEGTEEGVAGYVVDLTRGRTRAQLFGQMLLRHRIKMFQIDQAIEVEGKLIEPGNGWLIPAAQQQARVLKAIMEQVTSFQDSLFYDVSTWTMPLAFDVEVSVVSRLQEDSMGDEIEEIVLDGGQFIRASRPYAYLMRWNRLYAPRVLARLFSERLQARVARHPFTIPVGGEIMSFDRGTIILPVTPRNPEDAISVEKLDKLMAEAAKNDHVEIFAVETGYTPSGHDLGNMSLLMKPGVAILAGEGTPSYSVGAVWHHLTERIQLPVTLLDATSLGRADLDRYTTIIMPPLRGSVASERNMNRLADWVREGGTLVALESAVRTVLSQDWISESLSEGPQDSLDVPYADVSTARGARYLGGVILEANIDNTHPLGFGIEETIPVYRKAELFLNPSETPGATVARFGDSPLLSGYIHKTRLEELRNTATLVARGMGDGNVILMADDPVFRAFFLGSSRLLANAVFFGGVF